MLTLRNLWTNAHQNLSILCLCEKPAVTTALESCYHIWGILPAPSKQESQSV